MNGLFAGVVLGLSIAAPIGPMGVLCIERALAGGFASGFVAGLGAATVHAAYSGLTGLGLAQFGAQFGAPSGSWHLLLRILAIGLLFRMGGGILARSVDGAATQSVDATLKRSVDGATFRPVATALLGGYATAVMLTLSNPVTMSFFAVMTPPMPLDGNALALDAVQLPLGVFLGSALWWMVLSGTVCAARSRVTDRALRGVNRVCGLLIVGIALLFTLQSAQLLLAEAIAGAPFRAGPATDLGPLPGP
ncbi:LysE family translocator [Azospirillum sp. sgz302134]